MAEPMDVEPKEEQQAHNESHPLDQDVPKKDLFEGVDELVQTVSAKNLSPQEVEEGWIKITDDGGVRKKLIQPSPDGMPPILGSDVTCHYVGTLTTTGEKFDSSRDRAEPFNFVIGKGQVIRGWDIGIASMNKGERAILRCSSEYAYGEQGSGKIPPNATLDFDVELLDWSDWKRVHSKNSVQKRVIQAASENDYDNPKEGSKINITYTGKLSDGKIFAHGDHVELITEETEGFPEGFWECVRDMKLNEKCEFKIDSELGFGKSGNKELNISPNEKLYYEIELHSFENLKEVYEYNGFAEQYAEVEKLRKEGNELFKKEQWNKALKKYTRAIEFLENNNSFNDDEKLKAKQEKGIIDCNVSMVQIKLGDYSEAIKKATQSIDSDPNNIKALTRRGQAQMKLGNYEEAKDDFNKALKLEENNNYVKNLLKECKQKIKEFKEKERKLYANMFKK